MRLAGPLLFGTLLMVSVTPPPTSASVPETIFGATLLVVMAIIGAGWEISACVRRLDPRR